MSKQSNERLNALASEFENPEIRRRMMAEFGESKTAYSGVNADGETVLLSIASDSIIVQTHQNNGWVRVNEYDESGYLIGESYDGRWK